MKQIIKMDQKKFITIVEEELYRINLEEILNENVNLSSDQAEYILKKIRDLNITQTELEKSVNNLIDASRRKPTDMASILNNIRYVSDFSKDMEFIVSKITDVSGAEISGALEASEETPEPPPIPTVDATEIYNDLKRKNLSSSALKQLFRTYGEEGLERVHFNYDRARVGGYANPFKTYIIKHWEKTHPIVRKSGASFADEETIDRVSRRVLSDFNRSIKPESEPITPSPEETPVSVEPVASSDDKTAKESPKKKTTSKKSSKKKGGKDKPEDKSKPDKKSTKKPDKKSTKKPDKKSTKKRKLPLAMSQENREMINALNATENTSKNLRKLKTLGLQQFGVEASKGIDGDEQPIMKGFDELRDDIINKIMASEAT